MKATTEKSEERRGRKIIRDKTQDLSNKMIV